MRFGCGKKKFDMFGGFFQSFKKSIKGFRGEHVDFINNINFKATCGRRILHIVAKVADLVNPAVGSTVNFNDIERGTGGNFLAIGARIARGGGGAFAAINGFGKNAGSCGFPCAAHAAKKVSVRQPV